MALHDREAIVATVEETYALMGRAISTDIPPAVIERAVRPEIMQQIALANVDPYVTEEEMLQLLRVAYFDLVENVLRIHDELLDDQGERYDFYLDNAGLTGSGRTVKVHGFRRALDRLRNVPGLRWVRKAFQWGNVILGSLGGVPGVGVIADPVRELKESIEAQGDDDQGL
jgi:hypothetical protein